MSNAPLLVCRKVRPFRDQSHWQLFSIFADLTKRKRVSRAISGAVFIHYPTESEFSVGNLGGMAGFRKIEVLSCSDCVFFLRRTE